jgi:hypothetical protein
VVTVDTWGGTTIAAAAMIEVIHERISDEVKNDEPWALGRCKWKLTDMIPGDT